MLTIKCINANISKSTVFHYFFTESWILKSVRIRSFSGPYIPAFGLNTDQNNSKYGHFLRSRCYVYDDSIEEVVSHSRLLLGRRVLTKFNSDFNENIIDCDTLFRRKHYLQTLIDHYTRTDGNENICSSCVNIINLQMLFQIVKSN